MSKKFDIAIMNPPFDGNLHLKILEKVIPVAEEVVNISPIRWLQDPLAKYKKNSDLNKFEDSIAKHIESLHIPTDKEKNSMFDAKINMKLGIVRCVKENTKFNYKSLSENKIIDKIIKHKEYIGIKLEKYDDEIKNKFFIFIELIAGFSNGTLFPLFKIHKELPYGIFYKGVNSNGHSPEYVKNNIVKSVHGNVENWYVVAFDTENEIENWVKSQNTTFIKYIINAEHIDVHVHPEWLPWMSDYSKPWTNERFCEYFGITDEEWKDIEETMRQFN